MAMASLLGKISQNGSTCSLLKWVFLLYHLACKLRDSRYPKAGVFIKKHTILIVTFTELELEGIELSYTSNIINRPMFKISKPYKHKCMQLSTEIFKNVFTIILIRYINKTM